MLKMKFPGSPSLTVKERTLSPEIDLSPPPFVPAKITPVLSSYIERTSASNPSPPTFPNDSPESFHNPPRVPA